MGVQFQIIGGGLIGLATAYALLERGAKSVQILEAEANIASGTSFANAGMVHASLCDPWNGPELVGHVVRAANRKNTPLKIRAKALPSMMGWGRKFVRSSAPDIYWRSAEANFALAEYSLKLNKQWREALSIEDAYTGDGLLKIYRDQDEYVKACAKAKRLAAFGLVTEYVTPQEAVACEPALASIVETIAGGIYYPQDFKADAHSFCQALAQAILARGGEIHTKTRISGFIKDDHRVCGVQTNTGDFHAETTIVATGARSYQLLKRVGLSLPVRPVKGYSLSFPHRDAKEKPQPSIPVVDDSLHVAITPLKDCIRIAGLAELAGFDPKCEAKQVQPLLDMLKNVYPDLAHGLRIEDGKMWHGFRPVSADGIPFIGASAIEGLAVNTGHAHLGWTLCAGSGALLADMLMGHMPAIEPEQYSALRA